MDRICDYDEGYDRESAYDIGWCYKCKCNPSCLYKKKTNKENQKSENVDRSNSKWTRF